MLKGTLVSIVTHRELIWEMAKRDLKSLNKGAFLGYIWLFLNPFIQLLVYVIVVAYVFKGKLNDSARPLDYVIYVLSGMIPWQIITKSLQEAPSLIRDRIELVKQVIYPIEILPLNSLIVSSLSSLVSLCLLLVLTVMTGAFRGSLFFLPIPFFFLVIFVLGVSWIFSIVGVLLKDLREIVSVLLSLMVYVSPVVISESIVGPKMWRYILMNPFAHIIITFRDVIQATSHPTSWFIFGGTSIVLLFLGGWVITRTKILINEYI